MSIFSAVGEYLSRFYRRQPSFTEKDVPQLRGKVYMVTGANTGIGKELAQILYAENAKVYIAARSHEKAMNAIEAIKKAAPESTGELIFTHLDLADLTTIKKSVSEFLAKENKLHVLFNNAGVMYPDQGSKTAQGYELQLGTNNVGTHMLTKLLIPTLVSTAKEEPANTVRVVWVSSSAAEAPFCPTGGVPMNNLDYRNDKWAMHKYAVSKAGNYLQGTEFAKRYKNAGIVSVPLDPGNLNSELYRNQSAIVGFIIRTFILHPPKMGAYTELFAGLSPEVTLEKTGQWVAPWGRYTNIRKDLVQSSKSKNEGGTGVAEAFWEWNEEQIKPYL